MKQALGHLLLALHKSNVSKFQVFVDSKDHCSDI